MGNELCPGTTKDFIQGFRELEKGQKQYHPFFKCCLNSQTVQEVENISFLQIYDQNERYYPHSTYENSKIQPESLIREENHIQDQPFKGKNEEKCQSQQAPNKEQVNLVLPDGWKYRGEANGAIPEGKGEQIGPNGDYYQGHFSRGKKSGYGVYKFSNGLVYKGEFRQNLMWGHGIIYFLNGDSFEGEFIKNVREGKGKYIVQQPNIDDLLYFEGQYKNDLKNGPGIMKYVDHEVRGYWKDGLYDYSFQSQRS